MTKEHTITKIKGARQGTAQFTVDGKPATEKEFRAIASIGNSSVRWQGDIYRKEGEDRYMVEEVFVVVVR